MERKTSVTRSMLVVEGGTSGNSRRTPNPKLVCESSSADEGCQSCRLRTLGGNSRHFTTSNDPAPWKEQQSASPTRHDRIAL
jgi:hypothetical protein